MKNSVLIFSLILFGFGAKSQQHLSLPQAIDMGLKNNLQVNAADIQSQRQGIVSDLSKASMWPNLNASASYGINQGRSIDPFTNGFINQKVNYSNYGASSNVLLFNGGSLQNKIQSDKLGHRATEMELQQAKDNITINIILAYLQILSAQDVLKQVREQSVVTQNQVKRLEILNQQGAIAPAEYFDLKGQQANDEIAVSDNEANVASAKLNLCQLLNIPFDKNMQVDTLAADQLHLDYGDTPDNIYQSALQNFAQVKAVHLRTQSAEKALAAAKGSLFPTLSLGGNVNTNYSSAAMQSKLINTSEVASDSYVEVNGSKLPVMIQKDNFQSSKIHFGDQLNNNIFSSVYLNLSVPIFNGFQSKKRINLAKLDLRQSQIQESGAQTELQQSIERAYVNLMNSKDKYLLLQKQLNAFEESFRGAEIRFNAGAINSVDFLIAKNNIDRARTNLIMSRYDYLLRARILDYYKGK